ncbi:hypothetical protein BJ166DRAFT_529935 [Pestalotiopsis sp. NC0098]|nr:hypothetical protein BJ166DRAFT_529935 [Pestalotiopsis sp. NC0098]
MLLLLLAAVASDQFYTAEWSIDALSTTMCHDINARRLLAIPSPLTNDIFGLLVASIVRSQVPMPSSPIESTGATADENADKSEGEKGFSWHLLGVRPSILWCNMPFPTNHDQADRNSLLCEIASGL